MWPELSFPLSLPSDFSFRCVLSVVLTSGLFDVTDFYTGHRALHSHISAHTATFHTHHQNSISHLIFGLGALTTLASPVFCLDGNQGCEKNPTQPQKQKTRGWGPPGSVLTQNQKWGLITADCTTTTTHWPPPRSFTSLSSHLYPSHSRWLRLLLFGIREERNPLF